MVSVTLRPWSEGDLGLLHAANSPEMTVHLGGPESDAEVVSRHRRYLRLMAEGGARMFAVLHEAAEVGSVGWWTSAWNDAPIAEAGWFVLPAWQGRGLGAAAVSLLIDDASAQSDAARLMAFPSVANIASNHVCARNGFVRVGVYDARFRGVDLTLNAWSLPLPRPSA